MCIFSAGLDLIFSNVLKVIFVLSALSVLFSVQEITQKYAVTCMGSPWPCHTFWVTCKIDLKMVSDDDDPLLK